MSPRRAVVIGSGFGGLAAAVRLRAMGYAVTLIEALDDPGGRARVIERDGFTFDLGPSVVTAPHLLRELFELADREMDDYFRLVPVDPFYRILFPDGTRFDYVGEEERLLDEIRRIHPPDVEGYRRLAAQAERIFEVGFEQLSDQPFGSPIDMLRILPDMMRLRSFRPIYRTVSDYLEDPRLREVFTFESLLVGGNPLQVTSIYLLIHWLERKWGVHFALGGTGSIVRGLVRLLEELDVRLEFGRPVEQVLVEEGGVAGVRLADGEVHRADVVVSNADPSYLYLNMLAPAHQRRGRVRAVRRVRQSMGLFVGYFGTDRVYPELAHHTILMCDDYPHLIGDIFDRKTLSDDLALYLHAPTRTDPSLAPPGHDTFYVLSPVPNNRSGIDWAQEGEPYFDRILAELEERVMPGLREHVVTRFHRTPDYFEHTLRSVDGSAFGPEPILTQSAYFRYHNESPELDGLYFVGAGTHPGAGIPGVLSTAKVLDRIVPRPEEPVGLPASSSAGVTQTAPERSTPGPPRSPRAGSYADGPASAEG